MRVEITDNAESDLFSIFSYHAEYSEAWAQDYIRKLINFAVTNLSEHPLIGHPYNKELGLYRLIFDKKYNIYYQIKDETVYILYVIGGAVNLNTDLRNGDFKLPPT